jgi:hypothetical protein
VTREHRSSREAKKKPQSTDKEKRAVRKAKKDAKEMRPPLVTR